MNNLINEYAIEIEGLNSLVSHEMVQLNKHITQYQQAMVENGHMRIEAGYQVGMSSGASKTQLKSDIAKLRRDLLNISKMVDR